MTKWSFFTLVFGIILSIADFDCYAQIDPNLLNIPRPRPIKELIPDLKSHLNRMTLSYKQRRLKKSKINRVYIIYYLIWNFQL